MRFKLLAIILCAGALSIASMDAETKHILERGESLESIAKKYGVTTQQIIELNPEAASFTYIGMELTIPESCRPAAVPQSQAEAPTGIDYQQPARETYEASNHRTSQQTYPATQSNRTYSEDKMSANDHNVFSMAAMVTWQYNLSGEGGDFKTRSMYGIMAEGCSEVATNLGVGLSFGFRANYGLMPKDMGVLNGFLGPTIAIAFGESKTAGIYLPVCVGMTTDPRPKHDDTQWSCVILPHFAFSLNRVRINAGCGIDTDFSSTSVGLSIGLGYEF